MTTGHPAITASSAPAEEERELVTTRVSELLSTTPPSEASASEFLGAQFDAGLAEVSFPRGRGGLAVSASLQQLVVEALYEAGAPSAYLRNPIGVGHAMPTLVKYAEPALLDRVLRPMFAAQETWCQLFSEPGAGSDLAGLSTRAERTSNGWIVNGQKVWTSLAHISRWGILLARTEPDLPKHLGLTYFVLDMTSPGVTVQPLRQITGDAEFNEVFLDDVFIPDTNRVGGIHNGWTVAVATLMSERVAMGGATPPRGSGLIGEAVRVWQASDRRDTSLRDRLVAAWIESEALRLTNLRAQQGRSVAGPEGSIGKLSGTEIAMRVYDLILELLGNEGLLFDYADSRDDRQTDGATARLQAAGYFADVYERPTGANDSQALSLQDLRYGYLRSRANSIEAGSSQIMRTVLAERVLGLPREVRADRDVPWRDVPRGTRPNSATTTEHSG
jgi:alkylation response protein AidB-like acyl-CoA dehydrogenase